MPAIKHQTGFQREDSQMLHIAIADFCSELQEAKHEACVLREKLYPLDKKMLTLGT